MQEYRQQRKADFSGVIRGAFSTARSGAASEAMGGESADSRASGIAGGSGVADMASLAEVLDSFQPDAGDECAPQG
jgi:hypothetical protein